MSPGARVQRCDGDKIERARRLITGATSLPKDRVDRTTYMSDEAFADFKEALEEALAFERGEQRNLRVSGIRAPLPPKEVSLKDRQTSDD